MRRRDEFDDPQGAVAAIFQTLDIRRHIQARGPLFPALMVLGMIAVLAAVLWYSYPREAEKQALRAVPIIRADAGPYKIVPDDPGGMDIPHRDSTVFNTLRDARNKNNANRIENLLPEAERPLPRDELFAGLKTEPPKIIKDQKLTAKAEAISEEQSAPIEITAQLEKPAPVTPVPAVKKDMQTQEVEKIASVPKPIMKPTMKPEAAKAARTEPAAGIGRQIRDKPQNITQEIIYADAAPAPGSVYVQLGSLKSRAAAETSWTSLQKAFPSQLSGLPLYVQQADLGDRGTYFRVQAGPVESGQAQQICEAILTERPGGCLVVRN